MCVIAIYQKGKKPEKSEIEQMMKHNPDGAGIAWNNGEEVFFKKGFKTAKEVMRLINAIPEDFKHLVFHARIATSGGISAEKCHPFIISKEEKLLNMTEGRGKTPVFFHNGIFSITIDKGLNDSQTMAKNALAPLLAIGSKKVLNGDFDFLLSNLLRGSRTVILYPDDCLRFGEWHESNGNHYSNLNHVRTYYNNYYQYNGWDDWYATKSPALASNNWRNGSWYINNYPVPCANGVNYYYDVQKRVENANKYGIPPWRETAAIADGKPVKWDGKEDEKAYNKRVEALRKAADEKPEKTQNKLKIPKYYYENEISFAKRLEGYEKRGAKGIAPFMDEPITYNKKTYLWNGKETTHEYIRRVIATINGEKYAPLKAEKFKLIYNKDVDLFSINELVVEKYNSESVSEYYHRVKSYRDISNFTGCHYVNIAYANGVPILWDGKQKYRDYYDSTLILSVNDYPIKNNNTACSFENNVGIIEEVKA